MHAIYLDYNATTPVDPRVLEAMLPFLVGAYGNPSSAYMLGRQAHVAVEQARAEVAGLIGADPSEIVFTGNATEASNLAIRGAAALHGKGSAIVTTNIEHPATDACCDLLEREGHPVRRVKAGRDGRLDPANVAAVIDNRTAVVTVIHAQNEIGTIQPVAEIARIAKAHGALMHADGAQAIGKIAVDVNALDVDLLTIAGHKLYAPKGIGALFVRKGVDLPPLMVGAGQEHGRRPGTENVAFIVGLGAACRLAAQSMQDTVAQLGALRDLLLARLRGLVPGLMLVGDASHRLPNTLNVLFPGVSGQQLLASCPAVMASTGSACHAGSEEPSAILGALGIDRKVALGAVRLSIGRMTTRDEIEIAASALGAAWARVAENETTNAAE